MTCCVAGLCDDRRAIVMAADKMVGMGAIEIEPEISKILSLHRHWWVMLSGDDISPAFDIVDRAHKQLRRMKSVNVEDAERIVSTCYQEKRAEEAEARHLAPLGWTLRKFNSPASEVMPSTTRANITYMLENYFLQISLRVAGFDTRGKGHIFSVDDEANRGSPRRYDIPGYHSIGSGSFGAGYMMAYRDLSPKMPVRQALYYVTEGKYFGELASGVGTKTDLYIMRLGKPRIRIQDKAVESKLIKLCRALEPKELGERAVGVLNSLHGKNIDDVPPLKRRKDGKEWVIAV